MRIAITFFVSYARADLRLADAFLQRLQEQLAPSKRYAYTLWRDVKILLGERWHEEILQALDACQLGLLLLSPAFLTSPYIAQHELQRFVGEGAKPLLPVMLKMVDFRLHAMQGLEQYQVFRLDDTKAFAECTTDVLRHRFVERLFRQIEGRMERLYGRG